MLPLAPVVADYVLNGYGDYKRVECTGFEGWFLFCSSPKTFILSEKGRIDGLGILNTAFSLSSICFKREL